MFSSNASQVSNDANYIEDVFSTYLYTGNGTSQTITNGIDLSGEGGLVWTKARSTTYSHFLADTARGAGSLLSTNNTSAADTGGNLYSGFNSNGYGVTTSYGAGTNGNGATYASWTFRKQPKFFDVVTYTGTGAAQTIAHSLGGTVGALIIKRTSGTGNWSTFARTSGAAGSTLYAYFNTASGLNLTAAAGASGVPAESLGFITTTGFKPNDLSGSSGAGNADNINENGATYVAYIFAHDAGGFGLTGTDNVISCGSYTGNGSMSGPTVTLGYEPQWVLVKRADSTGNWLLQDNMRSLSQTNTDMLFPNLSNAATTGAYPSVVPTATGFYIGDNGTNYNASGGTYIYIAIRRGPMKVPTSGTSVFSPTTTSGNEATRSISSGFVSDAVLAPARTGSSISRRFIDRLRGRLQGLSTDLTNAESTLSAGYGLGFDQQDGITAYISTNNVNAHTYVHYQFRRAPGFFDEVCYTGDYANNPQIAHNLGVPPELLITKNRGATATQWYIKHSGMADNKEIYFNANAASIGPTWVRTSTYWQYASAQYPTGEPHVAYLFASCPGVSKVGSVTHVEPTTVVCGFTPRFVMLKSTASTGTDDWYVFDSARGITSGNDPYLRLNSTGAENTPFGAADLIDPTADGFIMNGFGGGNYIYLAIA